MSLIIANAERNTLSKKIKSNNYTIDDYEIDLSNQNDSHSILANHAIGSKRILDVGCGVGYIGRTLKKQQDCIIDGIDADEVALKIADKYYDSTALVKIEDETDKAYQLFLKDPTKYDCIVCGDILEHLKNPGEFLSVLASKLTSNGKILVSIPNVAHIDVIANLIDERFNYAETGILDNTHLRFWTESSFYDFVKNINEHYHVSLSPKLIAKTIVEHPILDTRHFRKICGDDIFTFQNIFELKKSSKPTFPHLSKKNNYHNILVAIDEAINAKAIIAQKDDYIKQLENSLSWKITKPLRKLRALLHRH